MPVGDTEKCSQHWLLEQIQGDQCHRSGNWGTAREDFWAVLNLPNVVSRLSFSQKKSQDKAQGHEFFVKEAERTFRCPNPPSSCPPSGPTLSQGELLHQCGSARITPPPPGSGVLNPPCLDQALPGQPFWDPALDGTGSLWFQPALPHPWSMLHLDQTFGC